MACGRRVSKAPREFGELQNCAHRCSAIGCGIAHDDTLGYPGNAIIFAEGRSVE